MPADRSITQLPAKEIDMVLTELHLLRKKWTRGEGITMPKLQLTLINGVTATGWLLDYTSSDDESTLLFETEGQNGELNGAMYVKMKNIIGFTVLDAPEFAHLISFGAIMAPKSPPPTHKEIQKKLADWIKVITHDLKKKVDMAVDWRAFKDGGDASRRLMATINDVGSVIREISKDPAVRQALASNLKVVQFVRGQQTKFQYGKGILRITDPYDPEGHQLTRTEVQSHIEELL